MIELFLLAFALSMDAFAVSIGLGIKSSKDTMRLMLKSSFLFGFFQGVMPLIGYLGGVEANKFIGDYDKLLALLILGVIGGNMIVAGFKDDVEESIKTISNKLLITLAFATSIDALAAGVTLVNFSIDVYLSVIVIGIVTFFFSLLGFQIGKKKGSQYESKGEILGGVILLLIGLKIYLF